MNNNINIINDILNRFPKETIKKAEKYKNFRDVVKCANSIKDAAKNFESLSSDEKRVAAILLSKEFFDNSKKGDINASI